VVAVHVDDRPHSANVVQKGGFLPRERLVILNDMHFS
jgi:hypothetical protein